MGREGKRKVGRVGSGVKGNTGCERGRTEGAFQLINNVRLHRLQPVIYGVEPLQQQHYKTKCTSILICTLKLWKLCYVCTSLPSEELSCIFCVNTMLVVNVNIKKHIYSFNCSFPPIFPDHLKLTYFVTFSMWVATLSIFAKSMGAKYGFLHQRL